jgi:chromate transporter
MTDSTNTLQHEAAAARGSPVEVFGAFLKLGLTSFGGPIAHLGYFRSEFVERRRWLDDRSYPIWSPCASSCPARPAARSAWRWGWAARAGWGCWRPGRDSPCRRRLR